MNLSVNLLSFEDAINQAKASNLKRWVLLGNGFSIACRPDKFKYDSLYKQATSNIPEKLQRVFETLNTRDFEQIMRALDQAAEIIDIYDPQLSSTSDEIRQHSSALRELLVRTIVENHPDKPSDISNAEYASCIQFLSNFQGYYTINYDLLLYWALMHGKDKNPTVQFQDGFGKTDATDDYVTWHIESVGDQNLYYLHGALHIYADGPEIKKYTWSNTGIRLITQIREALEHNKYPIFISEASSDAKMAKIHRSAFLGRSYRSFAQIGGSLFTYGISFSKNDEHIFRLIPKSKVSELFVGLYDSPDSADNQQVIKYCELIKTAREQRASDKHKPLAVHYYDVKTAAVWDGTA